MADGFRGIPGVPEGWELVRIGRPVKGEFFVRFGGVDECTHTEYMDDSSAIVRKIEKPKRYRQFASAEEFKPHRDRWVRRISDGLVFRCTSYGGGALFVLGNILPSFTEGFQEFVFDNDGSPFGVEVTDGE
jgi:hypothetical protein